MANGHRFSAFWLRSSVVREIFVGNFGSFVFFNFRPLNLDFSTSIWYQFVSNLSLNILVFIWSRLDKYLLRN